MFPTKADFFATPSPNADGALTELLRVLRSKPRAGGRVTILRQEAVRAVPPGLSLFTLKSGRRY